MLNTIEEYNNLDSKTKADILSFDYEKLNDIAKNCLSDFRYKHSLEVAKLCKEIAIENNYNPANAYIAGILHDITKEWDDSKTINYLEKHDSTLLNKNIKILHQYTCYYYLLENSDLDIEILDAIKSHSDGTCDTTLGKILYVADKYEKTRKYETATIREVALKNIDKAFEMAKKDVANFFKNKKKIEKVENYQLLAKYYDYILGDYDSLKKYWYYDFQKNSKGKSVLELGSGSGSFAEILTDRGYKVFASDISFEMLQVIKEKNIDLIDLKMIDMRNFELNQIFDNIVCICDSINYLNLDEIDSMFKSCFKHLKQNGLLFFDIHHEERLTEFKDEYFEEGDVFDIQYQWYISSNSNKLNETFLFFDKEKTYVEKHTQYIHKLKDILDLLEKNGFDYSYDIDFVPFEKILIKGVRK